MNGTSEIRSAEKTLKLLLDCDSEDAIGDELQDAKAMADLLYASTVTSDITVSLSDEEIRNAAWRTKKGLDRLIAKLQSITESRLMFFPGASEDADS